MTYEGIGMTLRDDARELQGELAVLRRALHQEPEIGLHLPRTQEKVLAALDGLPLEISTGTSLSSVTAVLRGGGTGPGGPVVLLRGDMDGLPVTERTGAEFTSRIDGAMHACGHDLHTAGLVGAARLLADRRERLAGDVVFMFQPGEEGWDGAGHMVEEGVLAAAGRPVDAAYGLHVSSSSYPTGVFTSRPGTLMAASAGLHVRVVGAGGHGSRPHAALDPVPVACEMVTALQTLVTRRFDVFDPVVVTVGSFHAGTTDNVIPDTARLEATIRSFSPEARTLARDATLRLIRDIATAHGLTADAEFVAGYPVTTNSAAEFEFTRATVGGVFGDHRFVTAPHPLTGSEDFSYVLEQVPGTFTMVGACPPGTDPSTAPYNHSAEAVFDDAIITDGTTLYAELAVRRLTAAAAQA